MRYEEALEYIHGVSNFFCRPGLERIGELCRMLGNPERELKFIHVTGTNGKGSVCSMLSSVLQAAGYRVGLYTSPYVRAFNERIRLNGESISDERLASLTELVKKSADRMADSPTEFELITAIALRFFKDEECDIVVLEVGMGGRFDATNIIPSPLLSVITGVSIDHTAFLGNTIEEIAGEKAGIIKKNSPTLYAGADNSAERIIKQESDKMQSKLYKTDYSSLSIKQTSLEETVFDYRERKDLRIGLLGEYQPKNAATVLDAVDILKGQGLNICEEAVRDGLARAEWAARFEIISRDPLVIFDGAHNPQGVCAAVKSIKRYFGSKRVIVLSGVLRDKDYSAIAESISTVAGKVYTITPDNPRALPSEEYSSVYSQLGVESVSSSSIREALSLALSEARKTNTPLFCLGSLYTYGEIITLIRILR